MKEIKVLVVDDEAKSAKKLCDDLSFFPDIKVLEVIHSPEKACKSIIHLKPDILFLDVEMPEMTGIELLKRIQPELDKDIKIVFYTAYNKYLIDALRASAFDFLLKPYLPGELTCVIERCRLNMPEKAENFKQSLYHLEKQENVVAVQSLMGLILMPVDKILLFQFSKEQRSWQIMDTNDYKLHKLRVSTTANELLALNKTFLQISKDCLVNMLYVISIENKSLRCNFCYPHNQIERFASKRNIKKIRDTITVF